jgi:hypothetical protein
LLGIRPDAPAGKLYIDPHLPEWLPELRVRDLRLGEACFDLQFRRHGTTTEVKVLRGDADAVERRGFGAEV